MNGCFCYRTVKSEFIRALNLFNHRTLEGIPEVYLPEPENEGEDILHYLGLDPTIRTLLLRQNTGSLIPSDAKLMRYFSFEVAVHIVWLYERIHLMLQEKVSFYFRLVEGTEQGTHYLIWSHKKFGGRNKIMRLGSMHEFISRVVRWLNRLSFSHQPEISFEEIQTKVLQVGKRTFGWWLVQRSGSLELIGDREIDVHGQVNAFLRLELDTYWLKFRGDGGGGGMSLTTI